MRSPFGRWHARRGRLPYAAMRLTEEEFAESVKEALAQIPPALARYLENVTVDVEPYPDARTCEEVGIEDPDEILGVYHGTPLTERSVEQAFELPDRITIFQRNIEDVCDSRHEIVEEIRTTVLHEIGHHFGLDEDDLDELGYA